LSARSLNSFLRRPWASDVLFFLIGKARWCNLLCREGHETSPGFLFVFFFHLQKGFKFWQIFFVVFTQTAPLKKSQLSTEHQKRIVVPVVVGFIWTPLAHSGNIFLLLY
jgi:hypothetical protein